MSAKGIASGFLKGILWMALSLVVILLFTITTVDRSPITEQSFYSQTFQALDSSRFTKTQGESWFAGWAKNNMTPENPVGLVGYAPRGDYDFVADSSYVKAITLQNGQTRIAWLSFELLIIHPFLANSIESAVQESKLPIDQLLFTATHTHSGMGGYMPGPLGALAFGGFDEEVIQEMVDSSLDALQKAIEAEEEVSISFRKSNASDWVSNRFVKDGPTDPYVRQLIFSNTSGQKATLLTYSAHATCLTTGYMGLSGDYPFYLMKKLEEEEYDFSFFASGSVGSHRPNRPGNTLEDTQNYAYSLARDIQLNMTYFATVKQKAIQTGHLDLKLREPHLRVSDNLRIRPWLFNWLVGESNAHLDITRIGNTLFIASSGEISGVFYEMWEESAKAHGLNLIITSFNGGYMGYITPDELYDEHFHEVREMNWYGPGNGTYYQNLIDAIILKMAETYP